MTFNFFDLKIETKFVILMYAKPFCQIIFIKIDAREFVKHCDLSTVFSFFFRAAAEPQVEMRSFL